MFAASSTINLWLTQTAQTHNVAMISPIAAFVVSLGTDGHVLSQGAVSDVLSKDHSLALASVQEQVLMEKADGEIDRKIGVKSDGKLIVAEEIAEGHVSWAARTSLFLISCSVHLC